MGFREIVRLALESLLAQKLRTALTILGMVIGVGATALLVSLGQGAKNYVTSEFEGLGTNLIVIQLGKSDKVSLVRGYFCCGVAFVDSDRGRAEAR